MRGRSKITLKDSETQGYRSLREAREFAFRRISALETDSSAGHVRPARHPRKRNGRSRNFNDHPSRTTANFSCARNPSVPRAHLSTLLHVLEEKRERISQRMPGKLSREFSSW